LYESTRVFPIEVIGLVRNVQSVYTFQGSLGGHSDG
jgi:hypothetical protein